MKSRYLLRHLLTAALLLSAGRAGAQDAQYWDEQFGTQANLLGGVVIGSVKDLSAVYYNPGALGLLKDTNFLLATKVFQYVSMKMPSLSDEQIDLTSDRVGEAPDFLAGEIPFSWLGNDHLAYSILTRHRSSFEIKGRRVDPMPTDDPDALVKSGEGRLQQNLSEYWGGITWAMPLNPHVGLGATLYGAVHSQRNRSDLDAAVVDPADGSVALVTGLEDLDYWNARLLVKLGVSYQRASYSLGLTLMTPGLDLFGQGSYFRQRADAQSPSSGEASVDPLLSSSYQDGLDAHFHNPWSVGLGGSWSGHRGTLHFSVEWFDAVEQYDVVQLAPYSPQTGGEEIAPVKVQELRSVINWGLGIEVPLSNTIYSYGSFATDYSAAVPSGEGDITFADWNIYQITGGVEIGIKSTRITLGAGYSFGANSIQLFVPGGDENEVVDSRVHVDYRRLKLMLGLSLNL